MFVFSNIEPACMGSIAGSKENQSIKSFRLKNTQLRLVKKQIIKNTEIWIL